MQRRTGQGNATGNRTGNTDGKHGGLTAARWQRGDMPGRPPPFGRLALVLHPHAPQSQKNGLYFMPDYSKGVYGAEAGRGRWKSIRLADIDELEKAINSGNLEQLGQQVLHRLQDAVDWQELTKDMVQSKANEKLATAEAMGAVIASTEQLSGQEAAQKVAQACVNSIM